MCEPLVRLGNIYIDPSETIGNIYSSVNFDTIGWYVPHQSDVLCEFALYSLSYTYIHVLRATAHSPFTRGFNLLLYPFFIIFIIIFPLRSLHFSPIIFKLYPPPRPVRDPCPRSAQNGQYYPVGVAGEKAHQHCVHRVPALDWCIRLRSYFRMFPLVLSFMPDGKFQVASKDVIGIDGLCLPELHHHHLSVLAHVVSWS